MSPSEAKQRSRATSLKRRYNLTTNNWEKIFNFQKGLCAICKRPHSDFTNRMAVDHDHSTRVIRGLLCYNCNTILPNRKNLIELLKSMIKYLESPPATLALGEQILANKLRRKKRK